MRISIAFFFLMVLNFGYSQVYTEKQTRHRFAQLNLGLDFQSSVGGSTKYIDEQGDIQSLRFTNSYSPRFLIGGTHFWGHADFYIAIPLFSTNFKMDNQEITAYRGVETVLKYYPYRIENNKFRPYIGASLASSFYKQRNYNFQYPDGAGFDYNNYSLLGGLTFNSKNHLAELGIAWNSQNSLDYHISRTQIEKANTPPIFLTLSYRYMIESTIGYEKDWESGKTKEQTDILAAKGKLNGFFIGAGMSSAFGLKENSYNQMNRPYISKYNNAIMPDFTFGYYLHKLDLNLAVGYRGYGASTKTYGTEQQLNRKSFLFEATKYLFDYHGFDPFIGPVISYENLSFEENFEGQKTFDIEEKKLGYGLTFGWDIRPNRIESWILRTSLRWYPDLSLEVEPKSSMSFETLEFNFIQLIVYPNRLINRKKNH